MEATLYKQYHPKLKRFTEKRDLTSLSNLEKWCKKMCIAFDSDILNQNSDSNETLHWLINTFPLILAYQGKTQEAEQFLHRAISYWSDKYIQNKQSQNLVHLIDPTINLLRLYKLTNQKSAFQSLMNEIAIIANQDRANLGGITVNEEILGEQWHTLYAATLDELLKFYILESNFSEVLKLKAIIPEKLKNSDVYLEAKVTALIGLGEYEAVIQLCWQQINKTTCIKNGVYSFRLYEAFMGMEKINKANTVMKHLISTMEKTPLDSLLLLTFSSNLIEIEKLPPSSYLVKKTLKKYIEINDEFNYGMTLCNLQDNYPSELNKIKINELYKKTDYIALVKRIEKTIKIKKIKEIKETNNYLEIINSYLNDFLLRS